MHICTYVCLHINVDVSVYVCVCVCLYVTCKLIFLIYIYTDGLVSGIGNNNLTAQGAAHKDDGEMNDVAASLVLVALAGQEQQHDYTSVVDDAVPTANDAMDHVRAELRFVAPGSALGHDDIPKLIVLNPDQRYIVGRELGGDTEDTLIHLDSACQRGMVSRQHATISFSIAENAWCLTDLDSMNGLLLNGIRVQYNALKEGVYSC